MPVALWVAAEALIKKEKEGEKESVSMAVHITFESIEEQLSDPRPIDID